MQLPLFAVFVQAVIIKQAVSEVGAFLYLRDQGSGADCVDLSRLDKKYVVLFDVYLLQIFFHRSQQDAFFESFPVYALPEAVHDPGVFRRIQHIPHFRFAQRAVFMLKRVGVVRMHLYRKVLPGID